MNNSIIINKYLPEDVSALKKVYRLMVPEDIRRLYVRKRQKAIIQDIMSSCDNDGKMKRLFKSVEIETINQCNGTCPFCPVNVYDDTRVHEFMKKDLFEKIINELSELDYSGKLSLFSNNEPFLDKRIVEFTEYARKHLPKAYIYLYTNGTLLTMEKFNQIMPYLDLLIIDNYNDNLELNDKVKKIYEYCITEKMYLDKLQIHLRKQNEILSTRGGQAPNNAKKETLDMGCNLPFEQMIVRPDGKLSLCCNDALGKFTLGNLNDNSIEEAWNSEEYQKIRKSLINNKRISIAMCEYCDTVQSI